MISRAGACFIPRLALYSDKRLSSRSEWQFSRVYMESSFGKRKVYRQLSPQPGVRGYVVKSPLEQDLMPAEVAGKHQGLPTSAVT
jgi:hypothetical protein